MAQSSDTRVSVLSFVEVVRADIRRLFRRSVLVALVVHAVAVTLLMQVSTPNKEAIERASRPLAVKFFLRRDPRVTKAFELRKAPQPKRRMIERQAQLAQASMDQVQSTSSFNTRGLVTQVVATPSLASARPLETGALHLEPTLTRVAVTSARVPDNKIDMALEMLDVNSMDTGRYRAMVVQDPKHPQAIKGFIDFALVVSVTSMGCNGQDINALVNAVSEYTGIRARFVGQVAYSDKRLMDLPIILPCGTPNQTELECAAKYLLAGGFIYGGVSSEALQKYGGLVEGKDFWTQRLTLDHPVFRAFFDIAGVPSGIPGNWLGQGKDGISPWLYADGYFIRGRLVGLTSTYGFGWTNPEGGGMDTTRQLEFAVNVVVYVLTQEGSITQRLMKMVD